MSNPHSKTVGGRARQVGVLGSAEPGSAAYELAGAAGELLAGGWSDRLEQHPPDERGNSRILS
jgi:hypothetical protein